MIAKPCFYNCCKKKRFLKIESRPTALCISGRGLNDEQNYEYRTSSQC